MHDTNKHIHKWTTGNFKIIFHLTQFRRHKVSHIPVLLKSSSFLAQLFAAPLDEYGAKIFTNISPLKNLPCKESNKKPRNMSIGSCFWIIKDFSRTLYLDI